MIADFDPHRPANRKNRFRATRSGVIADTVKFDLLGRIVLEDKLASQQALAIIVYDGNIRHA
jgi:hypothetical protein